MSRMSVIEWCVSVAVAIVLRWLWSSRQRKFPGPKRWPLLGCTLELAGNWGRIHNWLLEQFSDDRKTIHIAFAPHVGDAIFSADPANVEYFLKTNFANYPKGERQCDMMRELFGVGIFTTDGELWKEQRRVASYEFSSRTLRELSTDVFREHAVKLVLHLGRFASACEAFDLQDLVMRMTLDTTCRIGFGVEMTCLAPSLPNVPFGKCFDEANYISFHRFIDPLWKLKRALNIGSESTLKECVKVLDDFTYGVISEKRRNTTFFNNQGCAKGEDLLSRFTDLCNNEEKHIGQVFTDTALRDMILNFIIAGRDTTAATLSWFFYMMTCHPQVAHKIVEELFAVTQLPGEHQHSHPAGTTEETIVAFSKLLTYETLGNLHYLHAALSETLRLFPAVPIDAKEAAHDDVLPDGTVVKKGTLMGYVPYSMGRMKSLWGDDALDFKPERWLGQDGHFQPQPLFKFTAFQAGPRTCLGKDSAYLQMKMTAALALRFFSFRLIPGHLIQYQTMLVLHMLHGLQVTVTSR